MIRIEYTLFIWEPLIRVYIALLAGDAENFNEVLYDAIKLHKEYYDTDKDLRKNDWKGWVSWLLMAPVALAHDRGMEMTFKTDYLPEWMVRDEFADFEVPWES